MDKKDQKIDVEREELAEDGYVDPQLKDLGSIQEITQSGVGFSSDGSGWYS